MDPDIQHHPAIEQSHLPGNTSDPLVHFSFTLKRTTQDPDCEKYKQELCNMFASNSISLSYCCDVCGKDNLTKADVVSRQCITCNYWYDLCENDRSFNGCPFCAITDDVTD
jgi:hypothetical protein